jgi:adenosylhomocysteine nucleosidase
MGPAAAAGAAAAQLDGRVVVVVVAGVAGGCHPTLETGTVVVAERLCDLAGHPLDAPPPPSRVVATVLGAAPPAVAGLVASGDAVVDDPAARARLAAAGVLAVETEAAGWAPACLRAGVPLVVVRAILDTPARPLGAAAGLVEPGGDRPSPRRLLGLAGRPAAWASLPRLARAAALAERRAACAVAAVLDGLQRRRG